MPLKQQITDDMKTAMKSGEKDRLGVIRLSRHLSPCWSRAAIRC